MRLSGLFLALFLLPRPAFAQKNFGFDNRKPSGQDYLSAEETVKRFKMLPGWEANVFAAEPDVINPVAFTVDERGRLWVVECFEYPSRTPKGKKPRDRIRILEDTDGDGRVDKATLWAEGKNLPIGWDLATGIEVGHGGVYLGAPPYLFFLSDPGNTGKCTKQEILLKGFGSQDTHETLNTFQWGPDSKLYGLHGVFTQSQVGPGYGESPKGEPGASATGVKMNAAVWRYDPARTKTQPGTFDIFAEGTSNPWGMDFDRHGQCFLACCVIPHLFHMVPGGTYKRQAGASFNPYSFGLLNEICDHIHHKESGWAHAGLLVLEGEHIPKDLRGSLIMGSIHGCSVKRDELRPNGSTFIGTHSPDFLVSSDKNVRPINLRWGPDGSIYMIDWHDQNPCHQAPPDSWDQTRGRVYRLAPKGTKGIVAPDLARLSSKELVKLLTKENPYYYRTALRLLSERRDVSVKSDLIDLAKTADAGQALRGLWGLHAVAALDEGTAAEALKHESPWVRSWTVRLLGERGLVSDVMMKAFTHLADKDPAPQVRAQLASTCQQLKKQDTLPILHHLMKRKEDAKDPNIPLLIWLAYEPRVTAHRNPALEWLKDNAAGNPIAAVEIVPRVMRRLAATGKIDDLEACVAFIGDVADGKVRQVALEGLAEALKGRQVDAPPSWKKLAAGLAQNKSDALREVMRKLSVNFQDPAAIARALKAAADAGLALPQRLEAVREVALAHPKEGLKVLKTLALGKENAIEIRVEACRGLAGYDDPQLPGELLKSWKELPPALKAETVNLLAGRKAWAKELLAAVGKQTVSRTDLTDNTILRIRAFNDPSVNDQVEKVWGKFRDSPKELAQLIDKMRTSLAEGKSDSIRGRLVFENQCAKCHKFDGKGHDVGPNLDGAARDVEYLLVNILDPNRVVGQPYYVRTIELKNGRIETGLLHAEDDQTVTLKVENNVLKVIPRNQIEGKIVVQERSVMPEGLANNMTVQDFRDLIYYLKR